jgi:hypothetical protein
MYAGDQPWAGGTKWLLKAVPAASEEHGEVESISDLQLGSIAFWFFLIVLAERPSGPSSRQSSAAHRTL